MVIMNGRGSFGSDWYVLKLLLTVTQSCDKVQIIELFFKWVNFIVCKLNVSNKCVRKSIKKNCFWITWLWGVLAWLDFIHFIKYCLVVLLWILWDSVLWLHQEIFQEGLGFLFLWYMIDTALGLSMYLMGVYSKQASWRVMEKGKEEH